MMSFTKWLLTMFRFKDGFFDEIFMSEKAIKQIFKEVSMTKYSPPASSSAHAVHSALVVRLGHQCITKCQPLFNNDATEAKHQKYVQTHLALVGFLPQPISFSHADLASRFIIQTMHRKTMVVVWIWRSWMTGWNSAARWQRWSTRLSRHPSCLPPMNNSTIFVLNDEFEWFGVPEILPVCGGAWNFNCVCAGTWIFICACGMWILFVGAGMWIFISCAGTWIVLVGLWIVCVGSWIVCAGSVCEFFLSMCARTLHFLVVSGCVAAHEYFHTICTIQKP